MFARRDFLYKRSHNGAHLGLAARAPSSTPSAQEKAVNTSLASPSTSADSKTTDPITVEPVTKTAATSTASSSSTSSSSSTPATSSTPSQSRTSTSSASTSSSATPTALSTVSTPLTVASPTTAHVTTQAVSGVSLTPLSTLSPATTSSADSSSGTNTSTIVGGVAGALAGIAVLGFLLMWCMRRQRNRDIDDFDAQAFKRQSAILVDDPVQPQRSYNPRPPTMIERHNASPALAAQGGYGGQNFYGSYGGYSQQPPYAPPEMIQPVGSPPPQAYGAPSVGYAGYNDPQQRVARPYDSQQQLARQPSSAEYPTRQPSSAAGYAPPTAPPGSFDPNAQYIDLNRSSISPYQAAQYADISRQLGTTDSNAELPDGPLPSPFDDPVEATLVPDASPRIHQDHPSDVAAPGPVTAAPAPQTQGGPHQRPATVYEEGDAYSGI